MILSAVENFSWTMILGIITFSALVRRGEGAGHTSFTQLYQVLRDNSGQRLCCLDVPSAIMQVRSASECAIRCAQASTNCAHFNVRTSESGVRSCELYPNTLSCYGELAGCANYWVKLLIEFL